MPTVSSLLVLQLQQRQRFARPAVKVKRHRHLKDTLLARLAEAFEGGAVIQRVVSGAVRLCVDATKVVASLGSIAANALFLCFEAIAIALLRGGHARIANCGCQG